MKPTLSRFLFLPLAAVLGAGCVVNPNPDEQKDPCDPNPCTQGDKTWCVNEDGNARCLCKQGTIQRPSGVCEPLTTLNCPEHTGDNSEPDDCLTKAVTLASDATTQRHQSIEPVGDYDYFRIDGKLRTVYSVTVEPGAGALMPRLDVFDQGGVWISSQDGRPKAQVGFKARANAPYYVRVSHSPFDPSPATGQYALTLAPVGEDLHGDSSNDATTIVPDVGGSTNPTVTYGRVEYAQDEDWFVISATQGTTYRIEFDTNRVVPALAGFTSDDVKNPFHTWHNSFVEIRADSTTKLYLVMYANEGETGGYGFRVFRYN
ncbi:hypothetical protein [Archangium lansingense]|uniref:Uncharacterized protein n=1 Tax=Archangium lansingense TaxID=2995310 RepID=A0ABT4A5U6_9BACT|nr:hypothetical protein [Archangium lansinium]MCY1077015.1 hypothetical protein [Archangium lansinium]